MRVLVIIYEYPPVGGGGGRAAQDVCQELVSLKHDVRVLTAHLKGLPRHEEHDGIHITRLPSARRVPYKAGLVAMSGFVLAGFWAGLRYIRAWRPDVIHVHFAVPSGPVAWALSRLNDIPYVLTAHLGDVPGGVPDKTARWFRWIYPFTFPIWRDAARVTAVSEHTRCLAIKHYPVDVQVVPNGVNLDHLDPGQIKVNQPPQVIFAGRFMHQKNPLQVVRTLAQIKHLDWKCTMLGDGPLREDVMQEIRDAGLEGRVTLPGWVTPEEVIQWFSKSDILLMPSYSEGLPVVGVQALAMGLGIVASKIGGFVDIVDEGQNGYLVNVADPDGFARYLQELLTNQSRLLALRLASRQKAYQFDIHQVAQAYEDVFKSVAKIADDDRQ